MINQLNAANPITDENGVMTQNMRVVMTQVAKSGLLIGTGTPEGVVSADQGREYMDDAGIAGAILYIKRDPDDGLGDTSKGWILV